MHVSLLSLWLPILLAGVALFFASFLSWMVLQLHKQDWRPLPREDEFLESARELQIPPGNYMFPSCNSEEERKSEAFQAKWNAGPRGIATVFPSVNMGQNLALTMVYFLVVNFCLAYLASLALPAGAEFRQVFRFVSTAALMTYLAAIVQHSIWFRCRITGHVIESIGYAVISGMIFALLWPKS
jgi:hypothetical protein